MAQDTDPQDTQNPAAAAEAAGAEAPAAPPDVEKLQRERDEYYDRLLRKTAEFDNYRKRVERERGTLAQQIAGDVLETLLPVVDDFERALQADAGPEADTYRKGVELIYKQLQDVLARRGVKPVEAVGHDSTRSSTRRSPTSPRRGTPTARSSKRCAGATCSGIGCCVPRW